MTIVMTTYCEIEEMALNIVSKWSSLVCYKRSVSRGQESQSYERLAWESLNPREAT